MAACIVLVAGCGSSDTESQPSSPQTAPTSVDATVSTSTPTNTAHPTTTTRPTTTPPTTTPPPSTTTTTPPPTSTRPTTPSSTTTTPTGTPSSPTGTLTVPIPVGSFDELGWTWPGLFVLRINGDLELWSEALTPPPSNRFLVADYPDPFGSVQEGPGPNVIDHVAGEVNGSVVFGDCCEPISGNVLVATAPGEVKTIAGGYSPTLSSTGDRLATANDYQISVTSTDAKGTGLYRPLNQSPSEPYLNVADLAWSTNATATGDDDFLVVLGWTDAGWSLHHVDATTLEFISAVDLDVPAVSQAPGTDLRFAGIGQDAEIVVAQRNAQTTRLRYFSPTTLDERPALERSLPATATSIRVSINELMWVDGGSLYFLPAGRFDATRLGTGVLAAWFH